MNLTDSKSLIGNTFRRYFLHEDSMDEIGPLIGKMIFQAVKIQGMIQKIFDPQESGSFFSFIAQFLEYTSHPNPTMKKRSA